MNSSITAGTEQAFRALGTASVGIMCAGYVLGFASELYSTFRAQQKMPGRILEIPLKPRDQKMNRIGASINLVGAVVRLILWVNERSQIIFRPLLLVAFSVVAYTTGVFYSIKKMFDDLKLLQEANKYLEKIGNRFKYQISREEENTLIVYKYELYLRLFSQMVLGFYSGVELVSIITTAGFISAPALGILMLVSLVCLVVAFIFRASNDEVPVLERLRASDRKSGHVIDLKLPGYCPSPVRVGKKV